MPESLYTRAATWFKYSGISAVIHQPRLLRLISRTIQRHAWVGHLAKTVASRFDVVTSFERPLAFTSTANRPNLVAGDFAIGMESGPRHTAQRNLLVSRLPLPPDFEKFANIESRRRINALLAGPARSFDLVEDYMVPVAWQAIANSFGDLLPAIPPGDQMLMDLRYIGAHLIAGTVATETVKARARESAARLNAWVRLNIKDLETAWGRTGTVDREDVARNVVGLLWVGHPATVQSGALIMQEAFSRRRNRQLRSLVKQIRQNDEPWQCAQLRTAVRSHVLELLRFRPSFPILHRDVPRDTLYGAGGKKSIASGSVLTMFTIGAMCDPTAMRGPPPDIYAPDRAFRCPADRYLMFGQGARQCIARDQVVEMLTSALLGLLQLPGLTWADPWWRRVRYDGPMICAMRLKFRQMK